MERTPNQGGELQATHLHLVPPCENQHYDQESPDERVIREGIERALREGTELDDHTARYIASQLHEGQATALYSLASTGAIAEEVHDELTRDFDQQPEHVQWWINWLGTYCLTREVKGPVPGWSEMTTAIHRGETRAPEQPTSYENGARARQVLMERLATASVTRLGDIATVITFSDTVSHTTGEGVPAGTSDPAHEGPDERYTEPDELEEPDPFPWTDAARWSPDNRDDELARDRLAGLIAETPDEALGSVEEMGWFGLLRHDDRPGGVVLSQNSYGFWRVWETDSDEELSGRWQTLQREYDAFTDATGAHRVRPDDRSSTEEREHDLEDETESGHHPEIWVGSLSDYNSGRLHGVWLDATRDPEELQAAIRFMLRTGYDVTAEEWGIFDYDDFCGLSLGEYESLEVVSRVANGIAEHGEAFARWVEYVGEYSEEALTRFEDHYLGRFDSTEAYVEQVLEETEAYSFEEYVPVWLRPYVKIDVELLARDMEIELYVAGGREEGVYVFDPRF